MAPKKVAVAPAVEKENDASSAEETKAKSKVPKLKTLTHPTTLSMVVEVLKHNTERKGTSVQVIRGCILAAYPTVDPVRLKFLLRSALNKGIEKGILIRPANSSATGATGRFKLAKPGPKPKGGEDKMSENVDPNVQPKKKTEKIKVKAKKVVKKVSKKPKAEKEGSKDENIEEVKATDKKEKTSEPKAAAGKAKKNAAEKTDKAPAPAKKPKSKTSAAEEGAKPKKEVAKMRAESPKARDSEENSRAKSSKRGKK